MTCSTNGGRAAERCTIVEPPCALTPEPRQRLRQQTLEVDIVLRRAGVQETAFVEQDDLRGLAPLSYAHINPYGRFEVDLDRRIDFKRKAA